MRAAIRLCIVLDHAMNGLAIYRRREVCERMLVDCFAGGVRSASAPTPASLLDKSASSKIGLTA